MSDDEWLAHDNKEIACRIAWTDGFCAGALVMLTILFAAATIIARIL